MLTNCSQSGHCLTDYRDLQRKLGSHVLIKAILEQALEDCPPRACGRPHPRWESPQTYTTQQQTARQQAFRMRVTTKQRNRRYGVRLIWPSWGRPVPNRVSRRADNKKTLACSPRTRLFTASLAVSQCSSLRLVGFSTQTRSSLRVAPCLLGFCLPPSKQHRARHAMRNCQHCPWPEVKWKFWVGTKENPGPLKYTTPNFNQIGSDSENTGY